MAKIRIVPLSEIGEIITGNTPKTSDLENYESNDIPFLKPSDFSTDSIDLYDTEFCISEKARNKARILPVGSVAVTCIGIIGKTKITQKECAFNQQINAIIPFMDNYNRYIAYAINFQKELLQTQANAAVVPIINKTEFSKIAIPLPPLETQKQIAANLDKVTHTIDLCNNILEKLDLLVKSRFVEMFGDADRLIDKWKKKKFADVTINLDSTRKPVKDSDRKKMQGEYAYYGATGVVDHVNDYRIDGTYLLISEDGKALEFRNKDIAFIASGKIWVNNHAHVLQCTDEINMIFLMSYLNYRDISDWVTGIDQKKLNRANMDKIPVGLPPIELQNQFAAFVEQTDKSKSAVKQVLEKAETLKKTLMQEYFG